MISPGWGRVKSRKIIDLSTWFSQNIPLKNPFVAANMDTVTEARQAIAFAKEGGIGIIHRYLTIEDQCNQVSEVKREENFVITDPYSVKASDSISEAENIMTKKGTGCLAVLDDSERLVGVFTLRDLRFCVDRSQPVSKRMNGGRVLVSAPIGISQEDAKAILDKHRLEKLPLVDDQMRLVGLITSRDIENLEKYPLANKDSNGQLIVGAAIGATGDYLERSAELIKAGVDVIVLDIANAQSFIGLEAVKNFRIKFQEAELVVGNVAIPAGVSQYSYQGLKVNGFKVGLGPGSACTTRLHTNIGVSQAHAIYKCAESTIALGIPVIADGGIRRDGHVLSSLLFGASSVMIGGMFAGTDEAPGNVIRNSRGQKVKKFRGMASREAMLSKLQSEFAEDPYEASSRISPEGIEKEVEYRGSVVPIIRDMANHLASAISYMGAKSLIEAQELFRQNPKGFLQKISSATQIESWQR